MTSYQSPGAYRTSTSTKAISRVAPISGQKDQKEYDQTHNEQSVASTAAKVSFLRFSPLPSRWPNDSDDEDAKNDYSYAFTSRYRAIPNKLGNNNHQGCYDDNNEIE
jgi:hypothetical protein